MDTNREYLKMCEKSFKYIGFIQQPYIGLTEQIRNLLKELVEEILKWWKEHQDDTHSYDVGGGFTEDYNDYDVNNPPKFVTLAEKLKEE